MECPHLALYKLVVRFREDPIWHIFLNIYYMTLFPNELSKEHSGLFLNYSPRWDMEFDHWQNVEGRSGLSVPQISRGVHGRCCWHGPRVAIPRSVCMSRRFPYSYEGSPWWCRVKKGSFLKITSQSPLLLYCLPFKNWNVSRWFGTFLDYNIMKSLESRTLYFIITSYFIKCRLTL